MVSLGDPYNYCAVSLNLSWDSGNRECNSLISNVAFAEGMQDAGCQVTSLGGILVTHLIMSTEGEGD